MACGLSMDPFSGCGDGVVVGAAAAALEGCGLVAGDAAAGEARSNRNAQQTNVVDLTVDLLVMPV